MADAPQINSQQGIYHLVEIITNWHSVTCPNWSLPCRYSNQKISPYSSFQCRSDRECKNGEINTRPQYVSLDEQQSEN